MIRYHYSLVFLVHKSVVTAFNMVHFKSKLSKCPNHSRWSESPPATTLGHRLSSTAGATGDALAELADIVVLHEHELPA